MRRSTIVIFLMVVAVPLTAAIAGGPRRPRPLQDRLERRLPDPVTDADFHRHGRFDPALVELGRLLFFDKELSGNRNISCATCHHPLADTGDGLSLPVGEGGRGLGVTRDTGSGTSAIVARVPRNAPPVFNLGAKEFVTIFHDGRIQLDPTQPSGFRSPAGDALPLGLDSPLAAQAMFPVTSGDEMAGQRGENEIADAGADGDLAGPDGVWALLAARLADIDGPGGYVEQFVDVFDDIDGPADITFVHAANAIAAFESDAWRADDSPFDRYLRGDRYAMNGHAIQGMKLFYGRAACASCHAGAFQTDHDFHAVAMPQIGPGKGVGLLGRDDFGRELVTGDPADRYRFRTPTLRNVALTAPWGHAGAYDELEDAVRHMADPVESMYSFDRTQIVMPAREDLDELDFTILDDAESMSAIAAACELEPIALTKRDLGALVEFLHALTDTSSIDLRRDVPRTVPSGLPVMD